VPSPGPAFCALSLLLALASPARAEPPPPGHAQAEPVLLRRPLDCQPRKRRVENRVIHDCPREERYHAWPDRRRAPHPVRPDGDAPPESLGVFDAASAVPGELLSAPRHCPFGPVPALDAAPDRFIPYEDPLVGRCYLWAPLDRGALDLLGPFDRAGHLARLHPYLGAVILRALAAASRAGHRFHVISGVRSKGAPSWHTFGLAVDLNIHGRKGLREATAAWRDGRERAAWLALGEEAERLGLVWLGRSDPHEIFHFEWHPGWPGMPRGALARRLVRDSRHGGPTAVWEHLRLAPGAPSPLPGLRDAPTASPTPAATAP
jgi:hypothetical protein